MTDKRTVLVAGATGTQGGAVVKALLARGHGVIAMTRNPDSDAATGLAAQGVTVRVGDYDDAAAIVSAAEGADTAFVVTTPFGTDTSRETEQGKTMVDALYDASIGHIVFSSVASADKNTGIPHFDSKYEVERHLAALGKPYSVLAPAYFMENLIAPFALPALKEGTVSAAMPADRVLQQVSVRNIGDFAAALVERREAVFGKRFDIAGDELSNAEVVALVAKATGRDISYRAFPPDQLREQSEDLALMFEWFDRVGYSTDIDGLHREFPDIQWLRFADWVEEQDWRMLD